MFTGGFNVLVDIPSNYKHFIFEPGSNNARQAEYGEKPLNIPVYESLEQLMEQQNVKNENQDRQIG